MSSVEVDPELDMPDSERIDRNRGVAPRPDAIAPGMTPPAAPIGSSRPGQRWIGHSDPGWQPGLARRLLTPKVTVSYPDGSTGVVRGWGINPDGTYSGRTKIRQRIGVGIKLGLLVLVPGGLTAGTVSAILTLTCIGGVGLKIAAPRVMQAFRNLDARHPNALTGTQWDPALAQSPPARGVDAASPAVPEKRVAYTLSDPHATKYLKQLDAMYGAQTLDGVVAAASAALAESPAAGNAQAKALRTLVELAAGEETIESVRARIDSGLKPLDDAWAAIASPPPAESPASRRGPGWNFGFRPPARGVADSGPGRPDPGQVGGVYAAPELGDTTSPEMEV